MEYLDKCTVRENNCNVRVDAMAEKNLAIGKEMAKAMARLRFLQEELDTCEEQLASLGSSNDQCECPGTEVR